MNKLSQPAGWVTKKSGKWVAHVNLMIVDLKTGKTTRLHKSKVVGKISELTKAQAKILKQKFVTDTVGFGNGLRPDPRTTFCEFVEQVYFPVQRGRWAVATGDTQTYAIRHYIFSEFGLIPLGKLTADQLQIFLNGFKDRGFSKGTIHRIFSSLKDVVKLARKRKFIDEDLADEIYEPKTGAPIKRTLGEDVLGSLFEEITDPMDQCLMVIAILIGPRSSELFGLVWRAFNRESNALEICSIAYKRHLYMGETKTDASTSPTPIPDEAWPYIEAWRKLCPDTSQDALVFPYTLSKKARKGQVVPWDAYSYFAKRIKPIAEKFGISAKDICCRVFRRSLITDLQKYGSPKDAQTIARHKDIGTTLGVYTMPIEETTRAASNKRSNAIVARLKMKAA